MHHSPPPPPPPDFLSCKVLYGMCFSPSTQFVHKAINNLCEKTGLKYDDYFKLLPLADYSNLKHALNHVIKEVSREQVDKEQLAKNIQAMGASLEVSQVVATCLWVRKDEIHTQLVKESCSITQSQLVDFDWKLKVRQS